MPVRKAQMEADIQCTIEIVDALRGLAGAANDMANRSVTVMNNLIGKIDEATKQSNVCLSDREVERKPAGSIYRNCGRQFRGAAS